MSIFKENLIEYDKIQKSDYVDILENIYNV